MWREKNIYFTEHDIYFTKLMFILKNINLEFKLALRTKYIFYRILLYQNTGVVFDLAFRTCLYLNIRKYSLVYMVSQAKTIIPLKRYKYAKTLL